MTETVKTKPLMGLLLGDATGIGPELIVKALEKPEVRDLATWVIIGDERIFADAQKKVGTLLSYQKISTLEDVKVKENDVLWMIDLNNLDPTSIQPGVLSSNSGKISGDTLTYAIDLAVQKKLDGVCYAPLNKEALHEGGFHFQDEINFFASLLNWKGTFGEVNQLDEFWVTRVTSHIPLSKVSELVTKDRVKKIIKFAHDTVTQAGGIPKIAVAGLNPHAGDGGLMGREEIDEIAPAVKEAQEEGYNVEGPFPADTIYLRIKDEGFNSLVSMYHDQAQIGMKLQGFHRGVTISGGLPVVLTTPAHGTAFDIAGKGIANPSAMIQAMKIGVKMAVSRKAQQTVNK